MHHRVKNSLQLVTALLTTQARGSDVPAVREQLLEAAGRVATIGAVHERLYQDGSGAGADAEAYLAGLVGDLRRSMSDAAAGRTIELDVPPPTLWLPADRLTPLGLIVTELVTNALKYGQGRVRLVVHPTKAGIEVACEDKGPGFPETFDPRRGRGLGMRLVAALAKGGGPGAGGPFRAAWPRDRHHCPGLSGQHGRGRQQLSPGRRRSRQVATV